MKSKNELRKERTGFTCFFVLSVFLTASVGFAKPVSEELAKSVAGNRMLQQGGVESIAIEGSLQLFSEERTKSTSEILGTEYEDDKAKPSIVQLISPSGDIGDDHTPTYTWIPVSEATWYYLWVDASSGGNKIKKWYQSSDVCSGATCTVISPYLGSDSYTWWVQAWNSSGYGPWSSGLTFVLSNTPPPAATLVSPNSEIEDVEPTYYWNVEPNATWYQLWVEAVGSNHPLVQRWYRASESCFGNTCSASPHKEANPSPALKVNTEYKWWIQTFNRSGYGPWSSSMSFRTHADGANTPPPPTLIVPSGLIGHSTPSYQWTGDHSASWYYLWVNDSSGNRIKQWYRSEEVCSDEYYCSVTPSTQLNFGKGIWWIQGWNSVGYGQWSNGMEFDFTSSYGFNSQFNGDADSWDYDSETPGWFVSSTSIHTEGAPNKWASIIYGDPDDIGTMYGDFDYTVRLWREGSSFRSSSVIFRGKPAPLGSDYLWDEGYYFQYRRDGYYSVFRLTNGIPTPLKGWTRSHAIGKGSAWNTLRVSAIGTSIWFYINGEYQGRLNNSSLTKGKVAIAMFSDGATGTELWADYAVLEPPSDNTIQAGEDVKTADGFVIDEAALLLNGVFNTGGSISGVGEMAQD